MRVLEIASGMGSPPLPSGARLTATDLNRAMLMWPKRKVQSQVRVALQTADAMSLPLADGCSDTVACQFVVMFFPNKEKSYSEVNRVLAPRGRYVLNVVGCAPHHNPSAQIAMRVMDGFQ